MKSEDVLDGRNILLKQRNKCISFSDQFVRRYCFGFSKAQYITRTRFFSKTTWILKRQCMMWQRKSTLLFLKAFDEFCSFSTLCLWPSKQCISFLLGLQFLVFTGKIGQNYFSAIIPEHLEYYNTARQLRLRGDIFGPFSRRFSRFCRCSRWQHWCFLSIQSGVAS